MYFKVRTIDTKIHKYIYSPRICFRHCVIRLRRIFLIFLIICAFLFVQTLRKNVRTTKLRSHNISQAFSEIIDNFNSKEEILNTKLYGKVKEDTIIFVVETAGFSKEFNSFLVSLSKIRGIEDAFIIFSHYHYDETLSKAIRGIDFCRVLQIIWPYSIQAHSGENPGRNLNDRDLNGDQKSTQQTDENFFKIHSHHRCSKKLHWWWTANHIFEKLECTKKHTGLVIFMEDDLIFTQDFIYMAMYMKNIVGSQPRCEFVSMGTHLVSDTEYSGSDIYSAQLTVWDPVLHSSVLGFDISTWNIIAAHYELYCDLNNTSWSRTLDYISSHRMDNLNFKVVSSVTPRAFKLRPCKWFCNFDTNVDMLSKFEKANEENWFPPYVELYVNIEINDNNPFEGKKSELPPANTFDSDLCYSLSTNKIKKVIMAINI